MTGDDIQKLIAGLAPGGVLTLVPGAIADAPRIDALITQSFGGKLVATLGTATIGATGVTYATATLASATFRFYPHDANVAASLDFTTGSDGALDLSVTAIMPAGWTLAASFADVAAMSFSALNALSFSAAGIAVASARSPSVASITATINTASSATANFAFLLGEHCTVTGAASYVAGGNGATLPRFDLESTKIQGPSISNFSLDLFLRVAAGPGPALPDGSTPLEGGVDIATELVTPPPGLTVPILIGVTSADQTSYVVSLDTRNGPTQITSLDQLTPFTFGVSPQTQLAAANTPIGTLSLDYLFGTIDTVSRSFGNLQFQISLGTDWTVMDGLFKLQKLRTAVTIPVVWNGGTAPPTGSSAFALLVAADFIVATAPLEASISYPTVVLALVLQSGAVVDINAFLSSFSPGLKLPGETSDMYITSLSASADLTNSTYSLSSAANGSLSVIPGFTLTELNMAIDYGAKAVQDFTFGCHFTIANAPLALTASYAASNWQFEGGTEPGQSINLTDLLADILTIFGVSINAAGLPAIILSRLDMTYGTAAGDFSFAAEIGYFNESDPILKSITGGVAITYSGTPAKKWTGNVHGTLEVGSNLFTAELDFNTATVFTIQWKAEGNETVGIADLCALVGIDPPEIPDGLDLELIEVDGSYDLTNQILVLGAKSKSWGATDLAIWNDKTNGWQIYFGLATNMTIGLSNLPLVGSEIAKYGTVALDDLQAMASVPALSDAQGKTIAQHIPSGYPKPPPGGLPDGVALTMSFDINGSKTPISIGTAPPPPPPPPPPPGTPPPPPAPPPPPSAQRPAGNTPATASDGTKWFAVQQSIGPVSIQKVGVRYTSSDSKLWAVMNASIAIGGFELGLLGLGAGSPLTSFEPSFTISGVTVSMQEGEIGFSGALVGTIDPVDLYGEISLEMGPIALGALAGYAQYEGDPSFFVYAVLDAPIGGPSFFFVTGISAGFGINRQLIVPNVAGVSTFPLVQWAVGLNAPSSSPSGNIGEQVMATMQSLETSGVIAPQIGEYWFAIGLRFTSFELLDTFALVTLSVGKSFELDLLGLSTLALPPPPAVPLFKAQLALEASFVPSQGLLSVSGQLTSASYVLTPDCHITGGFAFYVWFLGDHAGEFVVTLGGYSTHFTPPDYYPVVPRLGLNWQVTNDLSITGSEYFALTSSAVMAGGGFSAVWKSGSLKAWFDVQADFLLVFQPLHYYLSASIDLGASFSIDLLFTTLHISIHVGVGAEIWGPDFSGKVDVDLDIISFTIGFGSSSRTAETKVSWNKFATTMLPGGASTPSAKAAMPRQPAMLALAAAPPPPPPSSNAPPPVLQINSSVGIIQTFDGSEGLDWLVDGHSFQCTVVSNIPIKTWQFLSSDIQLAPDTDQPQANGAAITPNPNFGVGPADISATTFASNLTLACETEEDSQFDAVYALANIPKAMWEQRSFDANGVPQNVDPLNDTTIKNVLSGFTLVPTVPAPDHLPPIPLQNLQYTIDPALQAMHWSTPVVQTGNPFSNQQTVQNTIASDRAAANRAAMIAAATRAGFAVSPDVDVSSLANVATSYLLAPTVLRYLGEAQ